MTSTKLYSLVATSLLATSAVAQTLGVSCYAATGYQDNCARFIDQFCDHATVALGAHAPNDSMGRCFNNGGGGKCDFNVWHKNPSAASQVPSNTNCKNALNAVTRNCPSRGHGQYNGAPFQFTVDPNSGQCSGDVSAGGNRVVTAAVVDDSAAA